MAPNEEQATPGPQSPAGQLTSVPVNDINKEATTMPQPFSGPQVVGPQAPVGQPASVVAIPEPAAYAPAAPQVQTVPAAYAPVPGFSNPAVEQSAPKTNAGVIILEWLTYAFWGWTVLALSALTATVLASFIADADTSGFTPYGIAAVLVLLPISFITDFFYSKKESQKKAGAEMLVMIIHAVLFALFGIGALIGAVFATVQLMTSSADTAGVQVGLYSCLIISVYYAMTFLRTLNPARLANVQKFFKFAMLATVGLIVILAIVGPVSQEMSRRDDKLIEAGIGDLSRTINNYAQENEDLPKDLNQLTLSGDEKKMVEKGLIEYKREAAVTIGTSRSSTVGTSSRFQQANNQRVEYRYQLCANYAKESRGYEKYYSSRAERNGEYDTYVSAYSHPAGEVCYKLKSSSY